MSQFRLHLRAVDRLERRRQRDALICARAAFASGKGFEQVLKALDYDRR